MQGYAFLSVFGPSGDPKRININYRLTKGFVFGTLFRKMQSNAPKEWRAELEGVGYSSPGFMRFKVEPSIASALRNSIASLLNNWDKVSNYNKELVAWSNGRSMETSELQAKGYIEAVGRILGFNGSAVITHTDSTINAAKVVSAYFRRIRYLAVDELNGTASIVDLPELSPEAKARRFELSSDGHGSDDDE
jgi:hypothetical protein